MEEENKVIKDIVWRMKTFKLKKGIVKWIQEVAILED